MEKRNKVTSIRFAILTVSDTCASGEKEDESGAELKTLINNTHSKIGHMLKGKVSCSAIVQDDITLITKYLCSWSDENKADVILTTGGTGFSERDVTPEATRKVIDKEAPGMSLAMLISSLSVTPMAMLSRAVCGIRNKTLIINLPGSLKAVRECLTAVAPAIPHAVDLILNNKEKVKDTHDIIQERRKKEVERENLINFECVAKRPRESPFPMISVEEAAEIMHNNAKEGQIETISVNDAYGRVLSKDIYSVCDLPPFRASIKDGYAVLASDGKGKRRVLGGVKAGDSTLISLKSGTCVRVNTGAPIPDDATAVVQVEDTKLITKSLDDTEEKEIEIITEVKEGQDIRPIGCDIKKGSLVLNACTRIGPAEMGLLAACGYERVTVTELPSVGILSTGDELQDAGNPLRPGRVYDSNRITLKSLLKENGFCPLDFGIVMDDESILVDKIREALEKVDVLVTTGSVSMGDRDMLKPVLQKYFQATIHFGRVNMKPGKPTTFATCQIPTVFGGRKKYFLCLPGNPVSAVVTARLFLLPFLNKMRGDNSKPVMVRAKLASSYNLDPRPEYARAILKWSDEEVLPVAYSTGNQISSKLSSCTGANALLMLPGRTTAKQMLCEGDVVSAILIDLK